MPQRIGKWAYWVFLSLVLAVSSAQSAQRGYTVQAGDTPCEIAERFGMRCVDFMAVNSLEEDDLIHIGQRVRLASATTTAKVDLGIFVICRFTFRCWLIGYNTLHVFQIYIASNNRRPSDDTNSQKHREGFHSLILQGEGIKMAAVSFARA